MCICLVLVLFVTCLEVRSYSVALAKLELDIPLPHPSKCWHSRYGCHSELIVCLSEGFHWCDVPMQRIFKKRLHLHTVPFQKLLFPWLLCEVQSYLVLCFDLLSHRAACENHPHFCSHSL